MTTLLLPPSILTDSFVISPRSPSLKAWEAKKRRRTTSYKSKRWISWPVSRLTQLPRHLKKTQLKMASCTYLLPLLAETEFLLPGIKPV